MESNSEGLLPFLRQALAAGTEPPAAILHAVADAARVLIDADGVAIAVRTKALVVCRARSGDIAPDLGSPINVDSGISGECLRTATILICNDAETDNRVDPEVCRILGIRSIVAVPLRGPSGIAGILEVFSTRPAAFGDEQIDDLRELAQIAESAYERECRARDATPIRVKTFKSAIPRDLFSSGAAKQESLSEVFNQPSRERRYWLIGGSVIALLLVFGVLWLSWHDPTPEAAASEPAAQPVSTPEPVASSVPVRAVIAKPEAGTRPRASVESSTVLRNAAEIQPAVEESSKTVAASEAPRQPNPDSASFTAEPTPSVEVAAAASSSLLPNLAAASVTMPALEVKVSQGLSQGVLIHKISPAYPPQARVQRIDGSVVLDATIDENGTVKAIKVISGQPLLAAAARAAVRQWRYSPPLLNGAPIQIQKQITVVFKLP